MPEDLELTGGATGGAADAEAGGSLPGTATDLGGDDGQKATPPGLDADFVEKLKSLDLKTLPEDVRSRLEKPFLSDYTRKTQELAEQRRTLEQRESRVLELALTKLQEKGVTPGPDQKELLKQRIGEGDMQAVSDLVETLYQERVQPNLNAMTLRNVFEETHKAYPVLVEPEVASLVQQTFSQNPVLTEMARLGNFEGAKFILRGLAQDVMLNRAQTEIKTLKEGQAAREKAIADKAVADYKAKVLGLPDQTSRAGTTAKGAPGEGPMDFRQAANAAYAEVFGKD